MINRIREALDGFSMQSPVLHGIAIGSLVATAAMGIVIAL